MGTDWERVISVLNLRDLSSGLTTDDLLSSAQVDRVSLRSSACEFLQL
jgi:hypothetical protein